MWRESAEFILDMPASLTGMMAVQADMWLDKNDTSTPVFGDCTVLKVTGNDTYEVPLTARYPRLTCGPALWRAPLRVRFRALNLLAPVCGWNKNHRTIPKEGSSMTNLQRAWRCTRSVSVATVGLLGVLGLGGCGQVGSGSVKTSGMYADFSVTATGDGNAHVRAALRVGGPFSTTFVDLQPGDSFTATQNGANMMPLARTQELLAAVSYTASFTGDAAATPFAIAMKRASDVSAPNSTTTLPAKFTLSAPQANAVASRAQALTISWDAASATPGDTMDVLLSGTCVQPISKYSQSDNGQLVIMAGELKPVSGSEQATCGVQITVSRKIAGTIDPAFTSGGAFLGYQQRTINISSTP
jgi:hypothetical protein